MKDCRITDGWKKAQVKSKKYKYNEKSKRIDIYNNNPSVCVKCSTSLPYEKRKNKFCNHSCSASYNNLGVNRNTISNGGPQNNRIRKCPQCKSEFTSKHINAKYCSFKCSCEYRKQITINKWIEYPESIKTLDRHHRKYLLEQAEYKCCQCGWGELNPHSNTYPLVVDHINGNAEDNRLENLRVLCPNCDALTSTYKSLNKGNGRHKRKQRYKERR